mmetsp:Transcript_43265/g.134548  ORF Transcript_43265/g.134548 Transcript_43265/m.134548 type:complete len:272 (+) Transcript_43265:97-912(+)
MGAAVGATVGCICAENRHEDEAAVVQVVSQSATGEELQALEGVNVNFANATPRTARQTPEQIEKRRIAAKSWLVSACGRGDHEAIQKAIVWAKDAGVSQAEIDDAEAEAARLGARRRRARDALATAVEERDGSSLRKAVSMADQELKMFYKSNNVVEKPAAHEAGIDTSEVEHAVELIEELEQDGAPERCSEQDARKAAIAHLEEAMRTRGQQELEQAIAEAEGAGMGTKGERAALAQARVMLKIVHARKRAAQERRAKDRSTCADEHPCL